MKLITELNKSMIYAVTLLIDKHLNNDKLILSLCIVNDEWIYVYNEWLIAFSSEWLIITV